MLITAGELIQKSIALYRDNFKLILTYIAIALLPWTILGMLFGSTAFIPTNILATNTSLNTGGMIAVPVLIIVGLFTALWVTVASYRVIAKRYRGEPVLPMWQEITASTPHVWPLIGSSILGGLAIAVGTLLFIIPGIIVAGWFIFSEQAVAIDGAKSIEALKESKHIVEGRWFGIIWRLAAAGFVFSIPILVAHAILNAIGTSLINTTGMVNAHIIINLVILVLGFLINILCTPLAEIAHVILYLEGKKNIMPMVVPPTSTLQM